LKGILSVVYRALLMPQPVIDRTGCIVVIEWLLAVDYPGFLLGHLVEKELCLSYFFVYSWTAMKLVAHLAVRDTNGEPITHAVITQLPAPDPGFLGLLAASGAGYLFYKVCPTAKTVHSGSDEAVA
jgi:hypothetical protein